MKIESMGKIDQGESRAFRWPAPTQQWTAKTRSTLKRRILVDHLQKVEESNVCHAAMYIVALHCQMYKSTATFTMQFQSTQRTCTCDLDQMTWGTAFAGRCTAQTRGYKLRNTLSRHAAKHPLIHLDWHEILQPARRSDAYSTNTPKKMLNSA